MGSLSDLLEQQAVNRSRLIEEPQFAHSNLEVRLRCIESQFCSANCGWWYGEEYAWSIVIQSLRVRSSGFWHLIRRDCQLVCMLKPKMSFPHVENLVTHDMLFSKVIFSWSNSSWGLNWTWKIHKLCQGVPLPASLCTLEHIIRYTARGHPLTQSTYHPVCVCLVGFKWIFGRGSCSWRPCSSTGGGPFVAIFSRMVKTKQQETSN